MYAIRSYYGNYLLPRKLALPVTQANSKYIASLQARRAEREAKEIAGAEELKSKIEKLVVITSYSIHYTKLYDS